MSCLRQDPGLKPQVCTHTHVHIHVQRRKPDIAGGALSKNDGLNSLTWPWPFACAQALLCIRHHLVDLGVSTGREASLELYLYLAPVPALDL